MTNPDPGIKASRQGPAAGIATYPYASTRALSYVAFRVGILRVGLAQSR